MIGLLYFLGGVLVTYVLSRPGLELVQRLRRHITWKRFGSALKSTFRNYLEHSEWKPDVIIGLNSGIVPASILALNLRVHDIYFYELFPLYRDGRREQGEVQDKGIDLSGKNVLIVDDQVLTGKSLEALYRHIISRAKADPKRIKRLALFRFRSGAGAVELDIPCADYILGSLKREPWIFARDLEPFWNEREPAG